MSSGATFCTSPEKLVSTNRHFLMAKQLVCVCVRGSVRLCVGTHLSTHLSTHSLHLLQREAAGRSRRGSGELREGMGGGNKEGSMATQSL